MSTIRVASCELPLRDATEQPVLLYWDGRLDNRRDLQAILGSAARRDSSDAAVVVAVYERWGIEGLGRVIGDWSLVVADPRTPSIVLASDYAGVRPLFYTRDNQRVTWSPELDALVAATKRDTVDEDYVGGFLTRGGHATRTPYAGVSSVPAGHAVIVTAAGETTRPLWTMPICDLVRYADERRYDEQVRTLFREGVAARLRGTAPVIAELSGGLDSSSVVCMAHDLIRRGDVSVPSLMTISYVHEDSLDVPYIKEVEAHCGITGIHVSTHQIPLATEKAVGSAAPQVWVPLHTAAARIADDLGASVFLTGQGGDLVMGNWFDDSLQVAAPLRRGRLGRAMGDALAWSKVLRVPISWILWRALRATLPVTGSAEALYELNALGAPHSDETSLHQGFIRRVDAGEPSRVVSKDWLQAPPERRKHFLALTAMRELRTLQRLESIRHLDYTHPFAHRPLVEFLMSVPPDVLCQPGQPRRLMRRALGDLWPARLRARRSKSLFAAPWIDALRPMAQTMLKTPNWQVVSRGWVDPVSLNARLQKLTRGLDCNEPQLRQIILLEYWLRNRGAQGMTAGALPIA